MVSCITYRTFYNSIIYCSLAFLINWTLTCDEAVLQHQVGAFIDTSQHRCIIADEPWQVS